MMQLPELSTISLNIQQNSVGLNGSKFVIYMSQPTHTMFAPGKKMYLISELVKVEDEMILKEIELLLVKSETQLKAQRKIIDIKTRQKLVYSPE